MRKRIILNDQGLYVDCIIEDGRISFEFEKGLETLNDKVTFDRSDGIVYGYLGLKRFVRIAKDEISKVMSITSTEIRILCAISNRLDYLHKKNKQDNGTIVSEFYSIIKKLYSLPIKWNEKQKHHTELHTHFTEMLNPEEFIRFINSYGITYPINDKGQLDFENGIDYTYKEIVEMGLEKKIIDSLRLDISKSSTFKDLTNCINKNRQGLLKRIIDNHYEDVLYGRDKTKYVELNELIKKIEEEMINIKNSDLPKKKKGKLRDRLNKKWTELTSIRGNLVKDFLYEDLLEETLIKLKKENIEYAEISFSNHNRLMYLSKKYENNNNLNFLYSIDRTNTVDDFKKSSVILESLLNTKKVIGVDIMGNEEALLGKSREEFKQKILWLLPVLHIHPKSLLRIHASEFTDASDNLYETLKIIDEASRELNDSCHDLFGRDWGVIPPPRIRIGHGVNIKKRPELIKLMKKYDVIVEINASSNYALGHIKSLEDLPIKYYEENKIKYVISTDGGGVYSTSIHQEENLVEEKGNRSRRTEKKQIIKNGSGQSKKKSLDLYNKIKEYRKGIITEEYYDNYLDALDEEKKRVGDISSKEQVNEELKKISRYIMDNDVELDSNYYNQMISLIEGLNNNDGSDYAKIYLYLFEKEAFPQRETPFKTLYYIDNMSNNNEIEIKYSLEKSLKEIYKIVKEEYYKQSTSVKTNDFSDFGKRR